MKAAQVSFEFMMGVMIIILLTTAFIALSSDRFSGLFAKKEAHLVRDVAFAVRNEVEVANGMPTGYGRVFTLPENLDGRNYSVSLQEGYVRVQSGSADYILGVPAVSGNLSKGKNRIIREEDGDVVLAAG